MKALKNSLVLFSILFSLFLLSDFCSKQKSNDQKKLFEKIVDGKQVTLFTLENSKGVKVTLTNYGGKIVNAWIPDRNGKMADIILGFNTIEEYVKGSKSFGATVGRYANRIAKGTFTLDGVTYQLPINNGPNCLQAYYLRGLTAHPT